MVRREGLGRRLTRERHGTMDDQGVPSHHGPMQHLHGLARLITVLHFPIADDEGRMIGWRETDQLDRPKAGEQFPQRLSGESRGESIEDDGTLHGNPFPSADVDGMDAKRHRTHGGFHAVSMRQTPFPVSEPAARH